ncbi:GNAT family N-acetyltransferase [Streptomyces sp. 3MP-14]|uniref:GNAT family N-acetyltransferase n=1 Tax=Streptomyces mimosae TaxID=2586635 RepID=A0A5N6AQT6_9ACTN|nr:MULTISPECIES: GNAT family N-acetyltransferase [Streptomyces]KAB8170974.1 GNAT family N-acetyltransferase [Streptomyces mimosae]KAB8179675.1 GNAT family N-acetyltransferase [Streptomyces sp. 3MP-14]
MKIRTSVVDVAEILPLRWSVLRPGLPVESAEFAEDGRPDTVHLAAYGPETAGVLACITLFPDPFPEPFAAEAPGEPGRAWRFRGMASDPSVRGRGYGAAVLDAASEVAAERGAGLLWCNGRTEARGFYERQKFAVVGEEFMIEGVGPHLVFARRTHLSG